MLLLYTKSTLFGGVHNGHVHVQIYLPVIRHSVSLSVVESTLQNTPLYEISFWFLQSRFFYLLTRKVSLKNGK